MRCVSIVSAICLISACASTSESSLGARTMDGKPIWRVERNFDEVRRGWKSLKAGNLEGAESRFAQVAERTRHDYERSQALFGLASVEMARENWRAASAYFEEVVALNRMPDEPHFDAILALVEIEYAQDDLPAANAWLERWRRQSRNPTDGQRERASELEHALSLRSGP